MLVSTCTTADEALSDELPSSFWTASWMATTHSTRWATPLRNVYICATHTHFLPQLRQVDNAVRHDSDKKSELGMILMAVQNLVQRCEKRNNGKGRRRRKAEEVTSSKTTKEDMKRKGEKAQRDLTTIQQYLSNYEDILRQCPKEAKNYKGGVCSHIASIQNTWKDE